MYTYIFCINYFIYNLKLRLILNCVDSRKGSMVDLNGWLRCKYQAKNSVEERPESAEGKGINLKGKEIKIPERITLSRLLSLCSHVIYIIALEIYPLLLHFFIAIFFLVAIFCSVFISYHRVCISIGVHQFSLISIFSSATYSANRRRINNISESTDYFIIFLYLYYFISFFFNSFLFLYTLSLISIFNLLVSIYNVQNEK